MRTNFSRHLIHLFSQEGTAEKLKFMMNTDLPKEGVKSDIPAEFNAKDWLTFLLHVDAELEHSLMIQYLYAAYSMGGNHIDEKHRDTVKGWQEIVLGIAKEEMGHFVSVQNVLRVIGAPLNFNRQDFPSKSDLYPFSFSLEPFSLRSLGKYVYAEAPVDWLKNTNGDDDEMKEIKKEVKGYLEKEKLGDPVSALFMKILEIMQDTTAIPDEVFMPETYPYQAKFDEWGRGYAGGARGNTSGANANGTPDVLVAPLMSRTDAINALREIAEQGESTSEEDNQLSHFERFIGIYKEWRKMPKEFNPARNVASNPIISTGDNDPQPSENVKSYSQPDVNTIRNPLAQQWAALFNIRYRMLLTFLTHSFLLDNGFNKAGTNSPRGAIIHATFGEMYNLRSIAYVLVNTPVSVGSDKMAGPPFQIPYTMDLPIGEVSRWRFHQDLIAASEQLIKLLLVSADQSHHKYLYSLREADGRLNEIANKLTAVAV